uniref:Uncharacterized protein n=1 Tax=Romanomermis culicivorax TaxID=13658 RepID=A0A915HJR9_ROMCU
MFDCISLKAHLYLPHFDGRNATDRQQLGMFSLKIHLETKISLSFGSDVSIAFRSVEKGKKNLGMSYAQIHVASASENNAR